MKNSLLAILILFSLAVNAQFKDGMVNFETAPYNIRNDFVKMDVVFYPGAGNIWQVGQPSKTFFDSAYSPKNAAVTDTVNSYPVNSYSYFDVIIHDNDYFNFMSMFSFKHKYNTTKGKDGGYIMASIDRGNTWDTIINAHNNMDDWCWGCPVQNKSSIYSYTDTLNGGMPAYSGISNGWITSSIRFGIMALKNEPFDTLIFRFIFQSDSIAETDSNEGWMIDDIYLSEHYSSGINHVSKNNNHIYPNPANSQLTISNSAAEIINVRLINLLGTEVKSENNIYRSLVNIDISELSPGIYLTEVLTGEGLSVHKIIVE
jgi:hypothetical protein